MVPTTQSADLRKYYSKHTKNDRLDSEVLEGICQEAPETVVVANYNSADQLVISGTPGGVTYASGKSSLTISSTLRSCSGARRSSRTTR